MNQNLMSLLVFLGVCLGVEAASGLVTRQSVSTWYVALNKPPWTPPGWIFAPVWTLLYVLMAVAAWLVWQRRASHPVTWAQGLFALQLLLNACWSFIFFGQRNLGLALLDIVLLLLALVVTVVCFWSIRPLAGALLAPYLVWVSFASALNYAIWRLNV